MNGAYQDAAAAGAYLDFLASENGLIQQETLYRAIKDRLPPGPGAAILDAGCGPGWLAGRLRQDYPAVQACDASGFFINLAKNRYPNVNFQLADLAGALPYGPASFDFIILNMVGPDLADLDQTMSGLKPLLRPAGRLLLTLPNPDLAYPAGEWKRSWLDVLLRRKPKLKLKKTAPAAAVQREFGGGRTISSRHYPLADYLAAAAKGGLHLAAKAELTSAADSPRFNLTYQLHRYPLLLLLEFAA
ncbi:MAG TPA: methyltransferase domain-containing protein [Patescibacteria group bacterium]|nr:methyltransferase domain-containing protein [Patescibacteria group bacterium]